MKSAKKVEVVEWPARDKSKKQDSADYRAVKVTNDNNDVVWYNYKTYIEIFGDPRQPGALSP